MLPYKRGMNYMDEITKVPIGISYVHHEIHEGKTFQASYKSPEGSDVADNGNITFIIATGARYCHIVFMGAAGGDTESLLYEAVTTSDDGVSLGVHNMNRNGIMTPSTAVSVTPTISDNGTLLHNSLISGGTGPHSGGGQARTETEWVLKPDTKYAARMINRSGGTTPMSFIAQWYEKG